MAYALTALGSEFIAKTEKSLIYCGLQVGLGSKKLADAKMLDVTQPTNDLVSEVSNVR